MRLALTLSCLGVMADIAYLQLEVAVRFLLIEEWALGAAYGLMGSGALAWLVTAGWRRAQAAIRQEMRR